MPSAVARVLGMPEIVIVWPALAPTWNCWAVKVPSSRLRPLNCVCVATRSISVASWATSCCSAARSDALFVAFADCTASSRMRCRFAVTEPSAPSATCASEMPSLALRAAWLVPLICAVMRSEIESPAASSFAELMRKPDDRRWIAVDRSFWVRSALRCAVNDEMLVLMIWGMKLSVGSGRLDRMAPFWRAPARGKSAISSVFARQFAHANEEGPTRSPGSALWMSSTRRRRAAEAAISAQQREDLLRQLVGLRHHRGAGLLQHLGARQVGGLGREVGVRDAAARRRQVFAHRLQRVDRRREAV